MKLKKLCKKHGLYNELKNAIYEVEFDSTLDGGWTIDNEDEQAKTFLKMNDNEKEKYAHKHAKRYVNVCMKQSYKQFMYYYDDQFSYITDRMNETNKVSVQ